VSEPHSRPSDSALQTFAERLAEFRQSLTEEQRRLLDALIVAGLSWAAEYLAENPLDEDSDMTPFWAQYSGGRTVPDPSGYDRSGGAAWSNTIWGKAWRTTREPSRALGDRFGRARPPP
jgi:hypothetical protein